MKHCPTGHEICHFNKLPRWLDDTIWKCEPANFLQRKQNTLRKCADKYDLSSSSLWRTSPRYSFSLSGHLCWENSSFWSSSQHGAMCWVALHPSLPPVFFLLLRDSDYTLQVFWVFWYQFQPGLGMVSLTTPAERPIIQLISDTIYPEIVLDPTD